MQSRSSENWAIYIFRSSTWLNRFMASEPIACSNIQATLRSYHLYRLTCGIHSHDRISRQQPQMHIGIMNAIKLLHVTNFILFYWRRCRKKKMRRRRMAFLPNICFGSACRIFMSKSSLLHLCYFTQNSILK